MIKSETKVIKSEVQKKINKSYKKLAISMGVAISVVTLAVGVSQMSQVKGVPDKQAVLPQEKSAEVVVAERVPRTAPRALGEIPGPDMLTKDSILPGSGVEVKASLPPPPVKILRMPLGTPTAAMMAGVTPKRATQALAVDAEDYITLPDGQRVKVNPGPAQKVGALSQPPKETATIKSEVVPLKLDSEGYATLPNGKKVKVEFKPSRSDQATGPDGQGGGGLKGSKPERDVQGYLLLPSGERKTVDTSAFPVDAEGNITLPSGKKVKAGDKVYLRLKTPEVDAEGFILLPNGERQLRDTSGLPVDAEGNITLPSGRKVKAGDKVYYRLKKAPELPKAPSTMGVAP